MNVRGERQIMSLSGLKTKVALAGSHEPLKEVAKLDKLAKKLGERIKEEEYDAEEIKQLRQKNRQTIQSLERTLERTKARELPSLEKKTMKEVRHYEQNVRRQIKDYAKIVDHLHSLIKKEDLELNFDLNVPLQAVNQFISLVGKQIKKTSHQELKETLKILFEDIKKEHEELTRKTNRLIHHELTYFNKYGLYVKDEGKIDERKLSEHIAERAQIKKDVRNKAQSVKLKIVHNEERIKKALKDKKLKYEEKQTIKTIIQYLEKQYTHLVDYCFDRVKIAVHMITESLQLQNKHMQDFNELKKEADAFYKEFLEEQEELIKDKNDFQTKRIKKRITQFKEYREEVKKEAEKVNERQHNRIEKEIKQDFEKLLLEKNELKRIQQIVINKQKNFSNTMKKILIILGIIASTSLSAPTKENNLSTQMKAQIEMPDYLHRTKKILETKQLMGNIPTILKRRSTHFMHCAEWSNSVFERLLGTRRSRVELGINDDAWQVADSVMRKGGSYIFNGFNQIQKHYADTIPLLAQNVQADYKQLRIRHSKDGARIRLNNKYAKQIRKFIPDSVSFDVRKLQLYDVVGLYQPRSNFQARAFNDNPGSNFNTHIGIVTKNEDGEIIISHNERRRLKHDHAKKLLKKDGTMILWVVRPKYNKDDLEKLGTTIALPKNNQY